MYTFSSEGGSELETWNVSVCNLATGTCWVGYAQRMHHIMRITKCREIRVLPKFPSW